MPAVSMNEATDDTLDATEVMEDEEALAVIEYDDRDPIGEGGEVLLKSYSESWRIISLAERGVDGGRTRASILGEVWMYWLKSCSSSS